MAISTYTDIFCDECGRWDEGATTPGTNRVTVRRTANKLGWTRKRVNDRMVDLCPECNRTVEKGHYFRNRY